MKKIYLLSVILVGGLFLGCTSINIASVQAKSSFTKDPFPNDNLTNMSEPIILLGDSQEHEDFGEANFDETKFVDKIVDDVTRRIAQANLNAIEIMKTVLKEHKEKPVIHLGDFLDVSCHDEFNRAINVLSEHDKWIIMLGNHDGYYVGNFLKQEASSDWAKRCDTGRFYEKLKSRDINKSENFESALDYEIVQYDDENQTAYVRAYNKSTVIERYLSTLFRKNREVNKVISPVYNKIFDDNHMFKDTNKKTKTIKKMKNLTYTFITSKKGNKKERIVEYNNNSNVFIKKIYAYINQNKIKSNLSSGNPQKSFLLQQVSLDEKVNLILLDTSVYEDSYHNSLAKAFYYQANLAGVVGGLTSKTNEFMGDNQSTIIKKWIKENKTNNITTIFAGHHPLAKVKELKEFFKDNLEDEKILYISAHTHQGFWRKHKGDNQNVTELNVGSLIDFPVHYRTLAVKQEENKNLKVISKLKEVEPLMVNELTGHLCKAKWNNYLNYPYADPSWQENEYEYLLKVWKSKHLALLPYLTYYLKLLETNEAQKYFDDFNISFQKAPIGKGTKLNRKELSSYLRKSIENFKKKINDKNSNIDDNNSCIKEGNGLTTRDCSNLLYSLRRNENKMFKNTDEAQSFFSTYKVCTALNAIEIDARTSKAKIIDHQDGDIDSKSYKKCKTLYECQKFEFENRSIEKFIIE